MAVVGLNRFPVRYSIHGLGPRFGKLEFNLDRDQASHPECEGAWHPTHTSLHALSRSLDDEIKLLVPHAYGNLRYAAELEKVREKSLKVTRIIFCLGNDFTPTPRYQDGRRRNPVVPASVPVRARARDDRRRNPAVAAAAAPAQG